MSFQFTDAVTKAIEIAQEVAKKRHNTEITENHFLLGLLEDPQGYFINLLEGLGGDVSALIEEVGRDIDYLPTAIEGVDERNPSRNLQVILQEASAIAKKWNDTYIGSDRLLLAYWEKGLDPFKRWKNGLNKKRNN